MDSLGDEGREQRDSKRALVSSSSRSAANPGVGVEVASGGEVSVIYDGAIGGGASAVSAIGAGGAGAVGAIKAGGGGAEYDIGAGGVGALSVIGADGAGAGGAGPVSTIGGGAVEGACDGPVDAMVDEGSCDGGAADKIEGCGAGEVNAATLKLPNFSKPFLIASVIC